MLPPRKPKQNQVYFIVVENYLQPPKLQPWQKPPSEKPLTAWSKSRQKELRVKLLEHPVLVAHDGRSKWEKLKDMLRRKVSGKCKSFPKPRMEPEALKREESHQISEEQLTEVSPKTKEIAQKWSERAKVKAALRSNRLALPKTLPGFLAFLRARNDDGMCKRKSGFEIYCELASIHGFKNFVGATTWQRALWCGIVCLAMLFSIMVLAASSYMSSQTPTVLYTESTTHPAWAIAFPAVTVCNVNRISRQRVEALAKKFDVTSQELLRSLRHSFEPAGNASAKEFKNKTRFLQLLAFGRNYSVSRLQQEIAPNCSAELLRCKWKGLQQECGKLFRQVRTPHGQCCSFNYREGAITPTEHTASCGQKTGLSVLLEANIPDYVGNELKSRRSWYVIVHEANSYPDIGQLRHLVRPGFESTITIRARQMVATDFVRGLDVQRRRCYFPDERRLEHFSHYTQANCLAECRSRLFQERCNCTLPLRPRRTDWPECGFSQRECLEENREISFKVLQQQNQLYRSDRFAENFICDCYPLCEANQYSSVFDEAVLNRSYAYGERSFFKNIKLKDHSVLHVFFGDLTAEKIRLDVFENWLSFIGTFGGITGLYMGYSFVSGFEMVFFVFVRPACNWLTRQQIRYRVKRRQKKAAAEKAKRAKAEALRQASEATAPQA